MKVQTQIPIKAYTPSGFIGRYQKLVKDTVIPYQHSVLEDKAPDTEKSHVIANFINAGRVLRGENAGDGFYGMVFQDSDAAKWLEATAYSLAVFPDKALEETADRLIDIIALAQDEDGYLDTCFTIKDRDKRWTNLLEAHELYCAGHMMEAACAYFETTGKRKLLDVMVKNAEHIYDRFVTQGIEGFPGHPEVELALMKLYRLTGNAHCLELAQRFIDSRGTDPDFYSRERERNGWTVWNADPANGDYQQSGKPVRAQSDATGHAVRAVYLYTAMADLASEIGDAALLAACKRLWESITKRRMYITGGIGSMFLGEAFSSDYDLPSDTAYCETCASIGLMFFASRMLENEIDGKYADVMERAFYNTVLAGMQLDGKRFFYVNPLEVIPGISGVSPTHKHVLPLRPKWYACACCPPNAARLISSFGKYAYGENENTAYCHLFAAGRVLFSNGLELECETDYPYDLSVNYRISGKGRFAVRIPSWSRDTRLWINGVASDLKTNAGYVYVNVDGSMELKLTFDDTARFVYPSPKVPRLTGKVALLRGPLVYCFEGVDNGGDVLGLSVDIASADIRASKAMVSGHETIRLSVDAHRTNSSDELYSYEPYAQEKCTIYAVPYYMWGNRGVNQMRVWMDRRQ